MLFPNILGNPSLQNTKLIRQDNEESVRIHLSRKNKKKADSALLGESPAPPSLFDSLIRGFKHILADTTNGTHPVLWDILESGARGDASIGVANCRIVYVTARCTDVLLCHGRSPVFVISLVVIILWVL